MRNYGRFCISNNLIRDDFESVLDLFRRLRIVVIRAESLYHRDCIEYIGLSYYFRELPQGDITPDYDILKIELESGEVTYNVKEIVNG